VNLSRHPEVRAAQAASLEGWRPSPFEARLRRTPQGDETKLRLLIHVNTSLFGEIDA